VVAAEIVVLDNLREVCWFLKYTTPHPHYFEMSSAHYGVVALPCESKIRSKGKVESGIGHSVKNTSQRDAASRAWKKRRRIWIVGKRWADTRIMARRNGVAAMFTEEKPHCCPTLEPSARIRRSVFIWRFAWKIEAALRLAAGMDRAAGEGAIG